MSNARLSSVFLDTSVMIAHEVHGPKTKDMIKKRIAEYSFVATSLIVRQEYKRRLLSEADYLLRQLATRKSLEELRHHIAKLPTSFWDRKKTLCCHVLAGTFGKDDADATERLQLYLHSLLTLGQLRFDEKVDHVIRASGCSCGSRPIKELAPQRGYDLGEKHCSKQKENCGIAKFVHNQIDKLKIIGDYLKTVDPEKKSDEIKKAEKVIEKIISNPEHVHGHDPCLGYGDLFIALEPVMHFER